jgi:choline dehydrogenase-like flavoprotein
MLISTTSLIENSTIESDVVIAGGGMSGIALARQLADAGLEVAVLESGEEGVNARVQELYRGKMTLGAPGSDARNLDDYLVQSRARRFGGSGNVWGGKCAPLDPIDFEQRDWLPHSGWPISRAQLQPYFDRACGLLGLERFDPAPERVLGAKDPVFADRSNAFTVRPRRFSAATGLGGVEYTKYKASAAQHARVKVYLNANVTRIRMDASGRAVTALEVRELSGRMHSARARTYILAMGGMENIRLMLVSDDVHRNGIGNHSDWLGRAFQGHATIAGNASSMSLHRAHQLLSMYDNRQRAKPHAVLGTSDAFQRKSRQANFTATLTPAPTDESATSFSVGTIARRLAQNPARSRQGVYFMTEHTPNRDSRLVLLRDHRDELGLPRLKLEMRFSELEINSLERSIRLLAAELGRLDVGRLQSNLAREQLASKMMLSRHHMGATRMAVSPQNGVVDENCRVHGVDNLYVAGSSVFPTSGIANPTLTLLALACRMGDHLIARGRV